MKTLAAALTILVATIAIISVQPDGQQLTNEPIATNIAAQTIDYLNYNAECTKTLEVECAVDIEKTVVACAKAF